MYVNKFQGFICSTSTFLLQRILLFPYLQYPVLQKRDNFLLLFNCLLIKLINSKIESQISFKKKSVDQTVI